MTDEIYINTYNEEFIYSWNANMDFQLCLDYHSVITYIADYYGKDESNTSKFIKEAIKNCKNMEIKESWNVPKLWFPMFSFCLGCA